MMDRFCTGFKPQVRLEVLKSTPPIFEQAVKIALNAGSALYAAELFRRCGKQHNPAGFAPMEIDNM